MKNLKLMWILILISGSVLGQKSSDIAFYFDNPIVVDSASTIVIPTRYNSDLLSSNKIELWGDVYANIIFYNFKTDYSKKLFTNDTYIMSFSGSRYSYNFDNRLAKSNFTSQYLFYRVKNFDRNGNGRIDDKDPAILYVSDIHGNNLKALTNSNENVLAFDIFEKQGFILVKIQRDFDNDLDFENADKDYYYTKLDLNTLTFGNKIELK